MRLDVVSDTRKGRLRASSFVPNEHLRDIKVQFLQYLRESHQNEHSVSDEAAAPVLSVLNHPPEVLSGPTLLHDLVCKSQDESAIALEHRTADGTRLASSYNTLHAKSEAIASRISTALSRHGRGSRKVIPVLLHQTPELYWTLLGILKAGCAFCPINLDAPKERIRFIVHDVSAGVMITDSSLAGAIPRLEDVKIIVVDETEAQSQHPAIPNHIPSACDPAYVMYTSGSTGTPKGVEISHQAVTQSLLAHQPHIPKFSRFLQFAAPTFDVSIFEIFFTLFQGATLVSCDRQHLLNNLPAFISEMHIDAAELTPTVTSALLGGRDSVPGLKVLLTIGEMLTSNVVREFGRTSDQRAILCSMYGPTEAAIHCTLEPDFPADLKPGIIGRPLATSSALILEPHSDTAGRDEAVRVLPVGQIGELAIGGPQLATGYLNRPEQNQRSYINHSYYGRLYRTGDRARLLPDGRIECLGRIDGAQIKLRGQRIELGEIEHTAMQVPGCKVSVASVVDGLLVLFCSGDATCLTSQGISEHCRKMLPTFMVPGDVQLLETVPRLPSGKVDKRKIEQDYLRSLQNPQLSEGQKSESLESRLCNAIGQHISRNIGRLTELSTVGVDSLRSIKLVAQLRRDGWNVSAMDLLKSRNVAQLSYLIRDRLQERSEASSAPSEDSKSSAFETVALKHCEALGIASDVECAVPCTPIQLSMLVETAIRRTAYFNLFALRVTGHSVDDVEHCLRDLVVANEMLRSGFCELKDAAQPYARIVWRSLEPWQIQKADLGSDVKSWRDPTLLRPIRVDLNQHPNHMEVVFNLHHALYDGWSVDLIIEELSHRLHNIDVSKRTPYNSVAEYREFQRGSEHMEASRTFWEHQMQNFSPHQLPNLHGHIVQDAELLECAKTLTVRVGEIQANADRLGVSSQTFGQAALAYLIAAYNGIDDVTFATVSSGRTLPIAGIESIVGPCLATLPLRISVSQASPGTELLRQVQQQTRNVMEHDSVTFNAIKHICGVEPGSLLCDVLVVWQETLLTRDSTFHNVQLVDAKDDTEFKVVIEFEPRCDDALVVKLRYRNDIFPERHAQMFLDQLDQVINALLKFPEEPIQSLCSSISPDILSADNVVPTTNTFRTGLSHCVELHAKNNPHEIALRFYVSLGLSTEEVETVTYAELNNRANALSRRLRANGVRPDDLVGICIEKSALFYISVLAVVKTGAGYLPIVPNTPKERITAILQDAEPRVCLVSESGSVNCSSNSRCPIIMINHLDLYGSHANLDLPYVGSHAAYAVYTSGSTGKPKGLLVTQDNLQSNLKELAALYPCHPQNRLLQSCSQAFDVSVFEIFFAWEQGMCLCSAANDDLFRDLERALRLMHITHLSLTPTVAALIDPENVPEVRFLITAGEGLTEQVFRRWAGKDILYQGYGPAETVNICTVRQRVAVEDLINNIGRPFPNTSAFVLHPLSNDPLPRGSIGELCFGGDQVCRGYLNRKSLNQEKFIQHAKYGRLYRSGDHGRMLIDGSILFTGRTDDQVKIRGQRVELSEINRTVVDHGFVSDCFSIIISSSQSQVPRLVTFWVPNNLATDEFKVDLKAESTLTGRDKLFDTMTAKLPTYMIPSNVVAVTSMPQTAQGKIDKRLLQHAFEELQTDQLEQTSNMKHEDGGSTEMSEIDILIRESVAQVLQIPVSNVRKHSSFFNLGLDSISAIQLSRVLQECLKCTIPVSQILKNPSISRLGRSVSPDTDENPAIESLGPLLTKNVVAEAREILTAKGVQWQELLPCTPLQISMLSASFSSSSEAYCNLTTLKINHDATALRSAILRVFERHPIFRTAFLSTSDREEPFIQVVLAGNELSCQESHVDNKFARDDLLIQLKRSALEKLNNLQPPINISFVSEADDEYVHLVMHHSLYDGYAMDILLREIEDFYKGGSILQPSSFEPFLGEVRKQQSTGVLHFWRERLDDYIPVQFRRLDVEQRHRAKRAQYIEIARDLPLKVKWLEAKCRKLDVTTSTAMQSAWAKALSMYLGSPDICFGNVMSGRHLSISGLDRLVAPCFNTIPVRTDLSGISNRDLLEYLQQQGTDSLGHSLTSLRNIQNTLELEGRPLFESVFLLQQAAFDLDSTIWQLVEEKGNMDVRNFIRLLTSSKARLITDCHLRFLSSLRLCQSEAKIILGLRFTLTSMPYPSRVIGQGHSIDGSQGSTYRR